MTIGAADAPVSSALVGCCASLFFFYKNDLLISYPSCSESPTLLFKHGPHQFSRNES